ncbi:VOC family protein [uncultured Sutterella sp.]|uniref:VOC family protein n=1 Tax=uncultured Sutterella sp. TaxID=286133 RepID=UPI0026333648|nr:VOC family protein [uncultured Sutterella sp.]
MKFQCIDHVVLTTRNLDKCLAFYRDLLGIPCSESNGRWTIHLGDSAIKIHCRPGEFLPAAGVPTSGSLDICLRLRENEFPASMALEIARNEIARAG